MRDIFEDIFKDEPLDPMQAARRNMRPSLRRRFYERAEAAQDAAQDADGFRVLLDGKIVRTPARRVLAAPALPIAQAIAAEWQAQEPAVDPARMPLTRLANSIIDGVADSTDAVAADIAEYLGTDLVFYRAGEPAGLVARQSEMWDPVLAFARDQLGARFTLGQGIAHVIQPRHAVEAARAALPRDPWRLGALHSVTNLTGSALLALALMRGAFPVDAVWEAAHVDEDWQASQWGRDTLAIARRDYRFAEMRAAAAVLEALRPSGN